MKKLNITRKQYNESKYFNKKYGALKYMSESGKYFKTDKGVVLALEGTDPVQTDESLSDIGAAIKKTGGEMVDKVKGGLKKAGKAIGDAMHGIYRKNDRVKISGKAGDVEGAVVSADKDEVVIRPDNERSFDESDGEEGGEITRGELTDMLQDVVDQVEKVCDAQDISFEEVVGVEPEGEADEADAEEVVATTDEVADALQGVIDAVEKVADANDIVLPQEEEEKEDGAEMVDETCDCGKPDCPECGGQATECGPGCVKESVRKRRARLVREAIARRARAKKIRESIQRRIRAKKVLESIRRRRAAKRVMESLRKRRAAKRVMESRRLRARRARMAK